MIKAALERSLQVELTGHLGYEKGDRSAGGSGKIQRTFFGLSNPVIGQEKAEKLESNIANIGSFEDVRYLHGTDLFG